MYGFTRYVAREHLKTFFVALCGITLVVLFVFVIQEAVRKGFGPGPVLRLIPYFALIALRIAVPATILFATCSVYGRMAADNEIVAIKSAGLSPLLVIAPALCFAFATSLVTVWLNDLAVTWGREGIERVGLQSIEDVAYTTLRSAKSYTHEMSEDRRFSISVKRVDGRRLIEPTLTVHDPKFTQPLNVSASEAELRFHGEDQTLRVQMVNSKMELQLHGGQEIRGASHVDEHRIPLSRNTASFLDKRPSELPIRMIPAALQAQHAHVAMLQQQLASSASFSMLIGRWSEIAGTKWNDQKQRLAEAKSRVLRLETERWRRWANGFSCLFFVAVGAPLAIRLRTADSWMSFGLCFLPVLIVYYPLLMLGVDAAKHGHLPAFSVWLGNAVFGVIGLLLIQNVVQH